MRISKLKIALVLVGVFLMFWHLVALPYMKANPRQRIKPPVLVEQGYKGYNIVKFQGEFYGVSQGEGPIDVEEIQAKAKFPWFKSVNLGNVHKNIDILADQIAKQNKRSFWEKVVGKVVRILKVIVD